MKTTAFSLALALLLMFSGGCGGSAPAPSGNGQGSRPVREATAEAPGLKLHLARVENGFTIELTGIAENYRNGPGTHVVFIRESSLKTGITVTNATSDTVHWEYKGTYESLGSDSAGLQAIRLGARLLQCTGEGLLIELVGMLTGTRPITGAHDLPMLARALGDRYIEVVNAENARSVPFGELVGQLQGGEPGIMLVNGQRYRMTLKTTRSAETLGLEVKVSYVRSPLLPQGLPLQTALQGLLSKGDQLVHSQTVTASLPGSHSSGPIDLSGEWVYSGRYGPYGILTLEKAGGKYEGEATWTLNPAPPPHYRFLDGVVDENRLLRGKFKYLYIVPQNAAEEQLVAQPHGFLAVVRPDGNSFLIVGVDDPLVDEWLTMEFIRKAE